MFIAMTHEMHGTHIAYSDAEVAECEKRGWKQDKALSLELAGKPKDVDDVQPKRGPGRPKKDE